MKLLLASVTFLMASCTLVSQLDPGQQAIGNRLTLSIDGGWNRFGYYYFDPAQVWTREGLPIDQLLVYPGITNGRAMHPVTDPEARNVVTFDANMSNEDLVALFERLLNRHGAVISVREVEPATIDSRRGVRFEFERMANQDSPVYRGVGFAVIDKGELFALIYIAPRLGFFPRHKDRVEAIARSAKIR